MIRSLLTLSIFTISVWCPGSPRVEAQEIYWSGGGTVRVAELDGSNPRDLINNPLPQEEIAIDVAGRQLYWFDGSTIVRSSLTGTNIVELVTITAAAGGFAVDVPGQKMYLLINDPYCQNCTTGVYRANLDGSGLDLLIPVPVPDDPRGGLAVDSPRGMIYWVENNSGDNRIQRANLSGSIIDTFPVGMGSKVADVAVNPIDGRVFWIEAVPGLIRRADFDGSNVTTLQQIPNWSRGLLIDSTAGKLYWAEKAADSPGPSLTHTNLRRSNLDGSDVELVRYIPFSYVYSLVTDPTDGHLYSTTDYAFTAGIELERTELDGSSLLTIVKPKFSAPSDLAVDEQSSRLLFFTGTPGFSPPSPIVYETNIYDPSQLTSTPFPSSYFGGLAISAATGAAYASDYRGSDGSGSPSRIFRQDANNPGWWMIIGSNLNSPRGLAIHDAGGKIYWVDYGSKNVQRCNHDGSSKQTVVTSGYFLSEIAIDSSAGKMYWVGRDSDSPSPGVSTISRANLDGTFQQTVVSVGSSTINSIGLDVKNSKLYWTTSSSIRRSDLDGSNAETIMTSGAHGIAVVTCAPSECGGLKNRFLSYEPGRASLRAGEPVAIRVKLVDLLDFPAMNGQTYWVAPHTTSQDGFANETLHAARLQCTPNVQDWTSGVVHLYGPEIVPDSTYEIQYATAACVALGEESCMSEARIVQTGAWGDIAAPFASVGGVQQPDMSDISACVGKFRESSGALSRTRAKLAGDVPDLNTQVSFADIGALVDAFRGRAYSYPGPTACP